MIAGRAFMLALGLGLVAACGADVSPAPAPIPVPELNVETYRVHIQPMFDRLCAQASCHGDAERSFRLYSRFNLRMEGHELENVLVDDEYEANIAGARGFIEGIPSIHDSELLKKPLRAEAGGLSHAGGIQFYDRADPSYVLLACWLLGGSAEQRGRLAQSLQVARGPVVEGSATAYTCVLMSSR